MLRLPDVPVEIATWEDLAPAILSQPPEKRWFNTPCCESSPISTISVPFGHLVFFGCGRCGRLVGGIAVSRDARIPDPKYLTEAAAMFAIKMPGSNLLPAVRLCENRDLEFIVEGVVLWRTTIATEGEVRAWKKELGKGDL